MKVRSKLLTDDTGLTILYINREIARICLTAQILLMATFAIFLIGFSASNEMVTILGGFAILASLLPIFYAVYLRKFEAVFTCISLFNLSPIWFLYLEAIMPGYDAYEYSLPIIRVEAFFWISMFQFLVNLGYFLTWGRASKISTNFFAFLPEIKVKSSVYSVLTYLAFIVPLLVFIWSHASAREFWVALTSGRADGNSSGLIATASDGSSNSHLMPFLWLWQLTPFFASITAVASKRFLSFRSLTSIFCGILVVFAFFLSGTRAALIFVAAPFIFFLFFYNWQKGWRFWIIAISLFIISIGVMEFQVRYRNDSLFDVLNNPSKYAKSKGLKNVTTFDPTQSHRDNNMYLFCLILKGYPEKYKFEGFNDFVGNVANPIPRSVWPGKPVLQGAKELIFQYPFVLDGPLFMGTTSLTYSIVGEAYLARGILGIVLYSIVYFLFLVLADGLSFYTKPKHPIAVGILGISVFLSFWSYRAFFSLTSYAYPLVLLIVALKFASHRGFRSKSV